MENAQKVSCGWKILSAVVRLVMRLKFNFSFDSFKNEEGPYLLLANHVTDFDPVFVSVAAGRPVRFVASEHIMRKGLGTKILTRWFNPIVHTKGAGTGMRSAMEMLRALKNGDRVGLFPEGNRCFNGVTCTIPPVTGKLAKMAGVNVITCRIEGGYLSQPRWGSTLRRGRVHARLVHVYTPEEIKSLSPEEIQARIEEDLHEDAYASQKASAVAYRSSAPAEGVESAVFACPSCRRFGALVTAGNALSCECGFSAKMDAYGFLHEEKTGEEFTVAKLDALQRGLLAERVPAQTEKLFSDAVHVKAIGGSHEVLSESDKQLTAYPDKVVLDGAEYPLSSIEGAAIRSRNTLNVFLSGGAQYEITGKKYFCGLKYLYLYRLHKKENLF